MNSDGLQVLVIDDEVQIRRFLRVSLEANGYHVHETTTGQEGLVKIAQLLSDQTVWHGRTQCPDSGGMAAYRYRSCG